MMKCASMGTARERADVWRAFGWDWEVVVAEHWGDEHGAAVLLVHGFNGDPLDMAELEEHLHARGFATRNLLLPGHGTHPRDLARTTWEDWSDAVMSAARELLDRYACVILVGHSMGAALSLHVAANEHRISGVAALCPPLRMYAAEVRLAAIGHRVLPYLPTLREDISDPEARVRYRQQRGHYRWTPIAAAHSLFTALPALRIELHKVRCPAMVMAARRDHVVPARDGIEAYRLLGTPDKELHVLPRSYHVITKDVERHVVFEHVGRFAERAAEAAANVERERGA